MVVVALLGCDTYLTVYEAKRKRGILTKPFKVNRRDTTNQTREAKVRNPRPNNDRKYINLADMCLGELQNDPDLQAEVTFGF